MAFESIPIIHTEPIPVEPGSPMTYEQGERMLQLMTDSQIKTDTFNDLVLKFQDKVLEKFDSVITLLGDIKSNTVPVVYDPSKPTGITYGQAQDIITLLHTIAEFGLYTIGSVALWFVIKQLYRFIGGVIFGGV